MKTLVSLNFMVILGAIIFTGSATAFEVGGARHDCRPPKFRNFFPPERVKNNPLSEAEPESEVSFTVSASADPESIKVAIRKKFIAAKIVNKNSFFKVTAKLPAAFNGKYARIDIWAKDKERDCKTTDGWLIKIKEATVETAKETVEEVTEVKEE